jgi:hypothetical protein
MTDPFQTQIEELKNKLSAEKAYLEDEIRTEYGYSKRPSASILLLLSRPRVVRSEARLDSTTGNEENHLAIADQEVGDRGVSFVLLKKSCVSKSRE